MSKPAGGLGRGLDALLKGYDETPKQGDIARLQIHTIEPNPNQPRRYFNQEALQDLADSIASQGVLQPILVRELPGSQPVRYELVAGERRWRASKLAGLSDIPAIIKSLSDEASLAIALIENLQREDLNPIEEALGYQQLQQRFGLNQENLAKRVGKSRPAVANALRLLQLPDPIQQDLSTGELSAGHARSLLAITDEAAQTELWHILKSRQCSVRETERMVQNWKEGLPFEQQSSKTVKAPKEEHQVDSSLAELEIDISKALNIRARCSGTSERGKITLSFASNEELRSLLQLFGLEYD